MRHKNTYTGAIVITVLLLIGFIVAGTVGHSINVNAILDAKEKNASWSNLVDFDALRNNITTPLSLSFFLFGIGGLGELVGNEIQNWFGLVVFTITSIVVIPLLLTLFVCYLSVVIVLYSVEFLRRDSEVRRVKMIGKWGMYVSFGLALLFTFIGIALFASTESGLKNDLDEGFKNYDTFAITTFLTHMTNGTVFGGLNSPLLSDSNVIANLKGGMALLVVLLPITIICLIAFGSMYIGVFVSKRESKSSRFFNWLKNIRIDSLREYVGLNLRNPWIWITSITFMITIIIPGFAHPYTTLTQILISAVNIFVIPLAFSPMIVGFFMAKAIKRFNYNLLMFVQILVLLAFTWAIQINLWVFFKDSMYQISWLSAFLPFITCSISLVGAFGFVKFSDK
ncbi:motility-associated protein Scm1 [Spiroplasma sp. BIUS-1]|uniref:motility-associated protein Scm1 n=1 Tax=Spiroplasma sp. BIUS-1 TaxID=216964 RepID=UPI001396F120|nr:motility-associated protein Scm1 [Spiroplasma sp. BIUS-1]QHX36637.1 motility-associated protein Scm1 [Spiroplasma sp. BIUS-1]